MNGGSDIGVVSAASAVPELAAGTAALTGDYRAGKAGRALRAHADMDGTEASTAWAESGVAPMAPSGLAARQIEFWDGALAAATASNRMVRRNRAQLLVAAISQQQRSQRLPAARTRGKQRCWGRSAFCDKSRACSRALSVRYPCRSRPLRQFGWATIMDPELKMRMEVHVHGTAFLCKGVHLTQVEHALRPWLDYLEVDTIEKVQSLEREEPGIRFDVKEQALACILLDGRSRPQFPGAPHRRHSRRWDR